MPADQVVAAVTTPSVETADLEALLRRLLLPHRHRDSNHAGKPIFDSAGTAASPALMDIETLLQRLLPVPPTQAPWSRPVTARRYW